VSIYNLE